MSATITIERKTLVDDYPSLCNGVPADILQNQSGTKVVFSAGIQNKVSEGVIVNFSPRAKGYLCFYWKLFQNNQKDSRVYVSFKPNVVNGQPFKQEPNSTLIKEMCNLTKSCKDTTYSYSDAKYTVEGKITSTSTNVSASFVITTLAPQTA